jgi:hypothetical protein
LGSSLLREMQRGSISPGRSRSPTDCDLISAEPSVNVISMAHLKALSAASRQRKVGEEISGGNIDPSGG